MPLFRLKINFYRHLDGKSRSDGSIPLLTCQSYLKSIKIRQLLRRRSSGVEQRTHKPLAVGSIPTAAKYRRNLPHKNPFKKAKMFPLVLLIVLTISASLMQLLFFREIFAIFQGLDLIIGIFFAHFIFSFALGFFISPLSAFSDKPKKALAFCLPLLAVFSIFSLLFILNIRNFANAPLGAAIALKYSFIYIFCGIFAPSFLYSISLFSSFNFAKNSGIEIQKTLSCFCAALFAVFVSYCLFLFSFPAIRLLFISSSSLLLVFLFLIKIKVQYRVFLSVFLLFVFFMPQKAVLKLDKALFAKNFSDGEVLDYKWTGYGQNALIRENNENAILSNHIINFAYPDINIIETEDFVHLPALYRKNPKTLLIISGASRYLQKALEHKIERIDYVEPDASIIELAGNKANNLESFFNNKRLNVYNLNARDFIDGKKYDLILIGLPSPVNLALNRYYTKDFFTVASQSLNKEGLLALKLPGTMSYSTYLTAYLNRSVLDSLKEVFEEAQVLPGAQNILIASQNKMPTRTEIKRRLQEAGENVLVLSKYHIDDKTDFQKMRWINNELAMVKEKKIINADSNPKSAFFAFLHLHSQISPYLVLIFEKIARYCYFLYFAAIAFFLFSKKDRAGRHFTAGFCLLWIALISIFSIQIYSGQILRFLPLYFAVLTASMYLGFKSVGILLKNLYSNTATFYGDIFYFSLIAVWNALLFFNLINLPILFLLIFLSSCASSIEINILLKSFNMPIALPNKNGKKKFLPFSAGCWGASLFGGGFLILAMGIQEALLFIMFIKFFVLCRQADLPSIY